MRRDVRSCQPKTGKSTARIAMVSTMTLNPKAPIARRGPTLVKNVFNSRRTHSNGYCRIEKIESGLNPDDVVVVAAAMITRRSHAGSRRDGHGGPRAS